MMGGFSGYILSQWMIRKSECGAGKQCVMIRKSECGAGKQCVMIRKSECGAGKQCVMIRKSVCGAGKQCFMYLLRNRMKNHVSVCCRAGLQQRTCLQQVAQQ